MKEFEKWYNQMIRPFIHNPKDKEILKEGWDAHKACLCAKQKRHKIKGE